MNLVSREDYEDYLVHEGVPNMKWGVRNGPPYPLDRTDGGQISKKQERAAARLQRKEDREAAKVKKQADKKAVQTLKKQKNVDPDKMTDEEKESMKKEVKRSKNIPIMMKYSDLFTTQEINDMANRIQAEQRLKDLNKSQVQKGMDMIKSATNTASTLLNAYDTAQRVVKTSKEIVEGPKNREKEAQKNAILKSKDPSKVYENRNLFTDKELKDFLARITAEDALKKKSES